MGESIENLKKEFEDGLNKLYVETSSRSTLLLESDYKKLIYEVKEAQELRRFGKGLSSKQYRRLNRYEVLNIGENEHLIAKRQTNEEEIKFFVYREQLFDIVHTAHINIGHKSERGMEHELKKKYANITREIINLYLSKCQFCQLKKKNPKKGLVVKPIISKYMDCRCQVIIRS
uniref:KRAB-A domain-containing protein 2-like isoform X1 n=1 Tax=Diabrotica virgifera virgifera TaxID=50390 RepID=A0A6P7FRD3_DIAVI